MGNEEKLLQILAGSACLKPDQLIGYLEGNLIKEELHVVELHLASCKLCREAVEGIGKSTNRSQLIQSLVLPELPARKNEIKKNPPPTTFSRNNPIKTLKKPPTIPVIPKSTFTPSPIRNFPHSKNLAWLGILSIILLLTLGGYLFWQYENSSIHWPSFSLNDSKSPEELLADSDQMPAKKAPSIVKELVIRPTLKSSDSPTHTVMITQDSLSLSAKKKSATANTPESNSLKELKPKPAKQIRGNVITTTAPNIPGAGTHHTESDDLKPVATHQKPKTTLVNLSEQKENKNIPKETTANTKLEKSNIHQSDEPANVSGFNTGFQLFQKKQYTSALIYLQAAAEDKNDPNHWQAVYYSGLCNLAIGKKGRGKRMLKRVEKAEVPLSQNATLELQKIEQQGNW